MAKSGTRKETAPSRPSACATTNSGNPTVPPHFYPGTSASSANSTPPPCFYPGASSSANPSTPPHLYPHGMDTSCTNTSLNQCKMLLADTSKMDDGEKARRSKALSRMEAMLFPGDSGDQGETDSSGATA